MSPLSLTVLISGNGTNLQAIIDAIAQHTLDAHIKAVISNNKTAFGVQRAQQANIPTAVLTQKSPRAREAFDIELHQLVDHYQADLVVLAGFMHILSRPFVETYAGKMVNIHPSLLPKYPGLHTHQRALEAGDEETGATIHFVTPEVDTGPIIAQSKLKILPTDNADSLKARLLTLEHKLYPEVLNWIAHKRIKLINDTVFLDDAPLPKNGKMILI